MIVYERYLSGSNMSKANVHLVYSVVYPTIQHLRSAR